MTSFYNIVSGVVFGFEETFFPVIEGASVEICAVVTSGSLERDAIVIFSADSGTATSAG